MPTRAPKLRSKFVSKEMSAGQREVTLKQTLSKLQQELALAKRQLADQHRDASQNSINAAQIGVFMAALLIYGTTLQRTVPGGDSGELIVEAFQLGLPHPPGYPLYAMLGYVASRVPLGNVAERLNAMSALFASFAGAAIYAAVYECTLLLRRPIVAGVAQPSAVAASLLFCASPLVWRYSIEAEVFALNNCFVSVIIWLTLRYYRTRSEGVAFTGAFLCGLALTNQHTAVLFVLPIVVMILHAGRVTLLRRQSLCRLTFFFFLGLLPYAYLPLGSGKLGSWGDCRSWTGFFRHITRYEYGTFQLQPGDQADDVGAVRRMKLYLAHLSSQLSTGGVLVACLGMWQLLFCNSSFRLRDKIIRPKDLWTWLLQHQPSNNGPTALFAAWSCYFIIFNLLSNMDLSQPITEGVLHRFWMQPNIVVFIAWGGGAAHLAAAFVDLGAKFGLKKVTSFCAIFILAGCVTAQVNMHFKENDRSGTSLLSDAAQDLLNALPKNSLILSHGDHTTNTLRYLQQVEGVQAHLPSFSDQLVRAPWFATQEQLYPTVNFPRRHYDDNRYGFAWEELFDANYKKFEIFACGHTNMQHFHNDATQRNYQLTQTGSFRSGYSSLYFGLCEWIVKAETLPTFDVWWSLSATARATASCANYSAALQSFRPDSWEFATMRQKAVKQQKLIADVIMYAQRETPHNSSLLLIARGVARDVLCASVPAHLIQVSTWKNIAVAYLTTPGAMSNRLDLLPGAAALDAFLRSPDSVKDVQHDYMRQLLRQIEGILGVKHGSDLEWSWCEHRES